MRKHLIRVLEGKILEKRERVRTTFTEKHTDVSMQTYTELNRATGDGH